MSTSLRLAIVGCGGMGHRHLMGLVELQQQGLLTLDLVAACDPVTENAESLARLAQQELGAEPVPVPDLASLSAHGVQAIDITSPPALHHHLIAEAADMGIHYPRSPPDRGFSLRFRDRPQPPPTSISVRELSPRPHSTGWRVPAGCRRQGCLLQMKLGRPPKTR